MCVSELLCVCMLPQPPLLQLAACWDVWPPYCFSICWNSFQCPCCSHSSQTSQHIASHNERGCGSAHTQKMHKAHLLPSHVCNMCDTDWHVQCVFIAGLGLDVITSKRACVLVYLRLCLYMYMFSYTDYTPAILIYVWLYLHMSSCTYISPTVIYVQLYYTYISSCTLYMFSCTYISYLAVLMYLWGILYSYLY